MQRPWLTALVVAGLLLIVIYGQRSGVPAKQAENQQQTQEVCEAVNEVKVAFTRYIIAQLKRAEKSLPTIDYYKRHPVELGKALANLERQREDTQREFAPTDC